MVRPVLAWATVSEGNDQMLELRQARYLDQGLSKLWESNPTPLSRSSMDFGAAVSPRCRDRSIRLSAYFSTKVVKSHASRGPIMSSYIADPATTSRCPNSVNSRIV